MSIHTEGQITAAAQWWADRLVNCRHSGLSAEERRDPENYGYQIAEMLMTVQRPKITDEQIEKFKGALVAKLSEDTYDANYGWLDVDYGPCKLLADALEAAGIPNNSTLPIKTTMHLHDGLVDVRYGYGAATQTIYPSDPVVTAGREPSGAK
jgi:hypothetical protein